MLRRSIDWLLTFVFTLDFALILYFAFVLVLVFVVPFFIPSLLTALTLVFKQLDASHVPLPNSYIPRVVFLLVLVDVDVRQQVLKKHCVPICSTVMDERVQAGIFLVVFGSMLQQLVRSCMVIVSDGKEERGSFELVKRVDVVLCVDELVDDSYVPCSGC